MNIPTSIQNTRSILGTIIGMVTLSSAFVTEAVSADGPSVTVAIRVDAHSLNLSDEADVRKFYRRIRYAAWVACTGADRVGLAPVEDPQKCTDLSLANAIRSVSLPTLTLIFLETHTLQQAAAVGIDLPIVAVTK